MSDGVLVRDSKNHAGPVLTFGRARLDAFVARTKAGDFDPAQQGV